MPDRYRPRSEPAGSLYDAFRRAARHRDPATPEAWEEAEVNAVHAAALAYAMKEGKPAPTVDDVRRARIFAQGSADFAATWAHRISEVMFRGADARAGA